MNSPSKHVWSIRSLVALTVLGLAAGSAWTYRNALIGTAEPDTAEAASIRSPSIPTSITALGRIEPGDGVRRVAGPSRPTVVIGQLLVEENDPVSVGQIIAVLDDYAVLESRLVRRKAWLANAQVDFDRRSKLFRDKTVSAADLDAARMNVEIGKADVLSAQAALDLATVRSPIAGTVLKIHARTGERVGSQGIAEIGETEKMYAVAEVYETDVVRVRVGQNATISSRAFLEPLHGTVERISRQVAKQDVLNTDPAAKTDARVVEVRIRLDEAEQAAGLTNLETEVTIEP